MADELRPVRLTSGPELRQAEGRQEALTLVSLSVCLSFSVGEALDLETQEIVPGHRADLESKSCLPHSPLGTGCTPTWF